MGVRVARVLAVAVLCAPWLAGCESANRAPAWWNNSPEPAVEAAPPPAPAPAPEITGAIPDPAVGPLPGATPEVRGDLNSALNLGKRHFRQGDFGLAEKYFRRAVEQALPDAREAGEAWLPPAPRPRRVRPPGRAAP